MTEQQSIAEAQLKSAHRGFGADLVNVTRGLLMGAADIIPGVSGGTVALIVGIYSRLVHAISRFDRQLIALLAKGQWRVAAAYIDLRFLMALGVGIGLGAVTLGSLIEEWMVESTSRAITLSVFFGMILASTWIVASLIGASGGKHKVFCVVCGAAAFAFAYWVTSFGHLGNATSLPYVFLCGAIGICAMILPGISGAYLLIILGFYPQLTDILHGLKDGHLSLPNLLTLGVFASGCFVGLVGFSKFLRWLLDHHLSATMAALVGFMLGAIRKVWPFQKDLTPDEMKLKLKVFEPFLPEQWDTHTTICLLAAIAAFVVVLSVDRFARQDRQRI